jgi:phosphatidylserine synthase
MTKDYAVVILMAFVVAVRLALWAKYQNEERGRRVGISTLQLLLVIALMVVIGFSPPWTRTAFLCALVGIIALSFIPTRKKRAKFLK